MMLAAMSAILSLMRSASSNDAVTFSHSASGILPPSLASAVGPLSSVGTIAVGTCVTRRDVDVKVLVRRDARVHPRAFRRREGRRREPTVGGTPPWRGRRGARGSLARRAGCRYRARGISIPGRPRRPRAPSRPGSPSRTRKVKRAASLVGENPSFVTLWAGFCQAACWAPSLFACAVALDSTRLARVLSNDTKRRCASVEPVQSPGRGLSMAEGRKRLAPSHSSPLFLIHFQCLISHAATRPSSVFNFGVS